MLLARISSLSISLYLSLSRSLYQSLSSIAPGNSSKLHNAQHRADVYKFLLIAQYCHVHVSGSIEESHA